MIKCQMRGCSNKAEYQIKSQLGNCETHLYCNPCRLSFPSYTWPIFTPLNNVAAHETVDDNNAEEWPDLIDA